MKPVTVILSLSLLLLTSCTGMNKSQQGAIGGAAGGAFIGQTIGHNTEATLIGMAVGTMLGYIVGNEMDKYDRQQLNHAYERGTSGQSTAWINPDSGNQYQITPRPAYKDANRRVCREAEIMAVIGGKREKTRTTACRDKSGHWQLDN